ncbi:MAG: hypothetical protein HKN44_10095, partial [Ilumatobacter sp.]|nr:hypothetical protein [Ilumatobacter sp.]
DRAFLDRVADHVLAIDAGGSMHRVPGGVAGWLSERAHHAGMPTVKTTPAGTRGKPKSGDGRGPSPSTIRRRLRETEQEMAKAQRRVDVLTEQLDGLTDHDRLVEVGAELAAAQSELVDVEARWLDLADRQESAT